jgi:hypothetical protein
MTLWHIEAKRALLFFVLTACVLWTPGSIAADTSLETKLPILEKLPLNLPTLDLNRRLKYNHLLTNARAFDLFRDALAERVVAIRARVTPKAPYDPRFPSWYHGCAFAYADDERSGWVVPTALIQDADRLEFRGDDGTWRSLPLPDPCAGSDLVLVQSPQLRIRAIAADPFGAQRALRSAKSTQIQINAPLFALSNLEGGFRTLDHGKITERGQGELRDAWICPLKLSAGTPLVNALGEVMLVRIKRGTASYELEPKKALECIEEVIAP